MKNNSLHIFWLIIITIIIFLGCISFANKSVKNSTAKKVNVEILENNDENKISTGTPTKPEIIQEQKKVELEVKPKKVIVPFVCPKPKKVYEDMWLLPLGQNTILPDTTYIPKDLKELKTLSSTKSGICLTEEARDNFEALTDKAKIDGYIIKASSGYRSFGYQENLLSNAIANGNQDANTAIAKAGYSEHQLGTAIDVTGQSIKYLSASDTFEKTDEAKWMEENAKDFGFIESYPLGQESITGYQYEPWHYRYVGIENAKEIIKSGLTTIEYLENKQIELLQSATVL